ncbi:MAG: DsbA family protein [Maricaulaceae bacterium]|jgi:protein-disulfide isomerase
MTRSAFAVFSLARRGAQRRRFKVGRGAWFHARGALKRVAALAGALAAVGLIAACDGAATGGSGGEATSEDMVLGDPNAPVTIIEYASITCPHCKAFHDDVLPELQSRYIDTGQVKLVFRELPTSPESLAVAGMLMARCAGDDKYFDVIDVLFERQVPLVMAWQQRDGTVLDELLRIAGPAGLSAEEFDACIRDEDAIDAMRARGEEGMERWNVTGTPAFIIDGELMTVAPTIEAFEERIEPLLGES